MAAARPRAGGRPLLARTRGTATRRRAPDPPAHRRRARSRNPVVITGDWHSTFVNDLKARLDDPDSPVVATEFVGTSISSNGDCMVLRPVLRADDPGVQSRHQVLRRRPPRLRALQARPRRVADRPPDGATVSTRDARGVDVASFVVEDGRRGRSGSRARPACCRRRDGYSGRGTGRASRRPMCARGILTSMGIPTGRGEDP